MDFDEPYDLSSPRVVGDLPTSDGIPSPSGTHYAGSDTSGDAGSYMLDADGHRKAHPAEPLPTDGTRTLFDFLTDQTLLPACPPHYGTLTGQTAVLTGTKRTQERQLSEDQRFEQIVYAPDMFKDIVAELKTRLSAPEMTLDFSLTPHRDWAMALFPPHTSQYLDGPIRCEKSVELLTWKAFFIPALAVCHALKAGRIPRRAKRFPYISPPIQNGTAITDFQLVSNELPRERIALRAEIKCPPVLQLQHAAADDRREAGGKAERQFGGYWRLELGTSTETAEHLFDQLQELTPFFHLGDAIRFKWPTVTTYQTKLTKVLMQLWDQLILDEGKNKGLNILTSYEWTTFIVRQGNTMYLSRNYGVESGVLLYICGMMALSLGLLRSKLDLPRPNTSWWPDPTNVIGVDTNTLPVEKAPPRSVAAAKGNTKATRARKTQAVRTRAKGATTRSRAKAARAASSSRS